MPKSRRSEKPKAKHVLREVKILRPNLPPEIGYYCVSCGVVYSRRMVELAAFCPEDHTL